MLLRWKRALSLLIVMVLFAQAVPAFGEAAAEAIRSAAYQAAATKANQPKKIAITGSKYVAKGKKITLKAAVNPEKASKQVTWKSADPKIATVSSKGVVTGKKAGKVKITAASKANPKIKKTFTVTVTAKAVTSVSVTGDTELNLSDRTKVTLKAKAKPAKAAQSFTWKSSNTKVATVSAKGVVKAVGEGKAKITATATDGSKKKATVTVHVTGAPDDEGILEKIPLEDITDEEVLEKAREWNDLVAEVEQFDKENAQDIETITNAANEMADTLAGLNLRTGDGGFAISGGDISYSLSGLTGNLDGVTALTDQIRYEEGTASIPLSNGLTLYCTESGIRVGQGTSRAGAVRFDSYPRKTDISNTMFAVSLIKDQLENMLGIFGEKVDKMAERYNKLGSKLKKAVKVYKKDPLLGEKTEYYKNLKLRKATVSAAGIALKTAAKSLSLLGTYLDIQDMLEDIENLNAVQAIYDHGHPTEYDSKYKDLAELAEELNIWCGISTCSCYADIMLILIGMGIDASKAIATVAAFIPGLQGVALGTWASSQLLDLEVASLQTCLHSVAKSAVAAVKETDQKLHDDTGTIPIDAINFPDEDFRQYVLDFIDQNKDELISEREQPGKIQVYGNTAKSLEGIKLLSKLTELSWQAGQLESLDISGMTTLTYMSCNTNPIKTFNASGCTSLPAFDIANCWNLTDADISGCTGITQFTYPGFGFVRLNASECSALTTLDCSNCKIQELHLEGCVSLETLSCQKNEMKDLILPELPALKTVHLGNENMNSADVTRCAALTELKISGTIETLNAGGCASLETITFPDKNGKYSNIDLSGCTAMKKLSCSDNGISSLNVSGCSALESLNCSANNISRLDLSGCASLGSVDCSENKISQLDLSGCASLKTINCRTNSLGSLDCSDCVNLNSIVITDNLFTALPQELPSGIHSIYCTDNKIGSLNVKQFPNLVNLFCSLNLISFLDVSGMIYLEKLCCVQKYQMSSVDVRDCYSLGVAALRAPEYPSYPLNIYTNENTSSRYGAVYTPFYRYNDWYQ